ncbi:MAG: hypothetical protein HRT57_16605 [Crocinitomicaceae bacterium]|nr:hypothetical protein [Crocinitomicaceae bacterium]
MKIAITAFTMRQEKLVVPLEYDLIAINNFQMDSCSSPTLNHALCKKNGAKFYVINLQNQKRSEVHKSIRNVKGRSIFYDGKKWGILDTNMQLIYENKHYYNWQRLAE